MKHPEPLRISASGLRAFGECNYRYARDYVERLPDEERVPIAVFAFGEAIHKALAQFIRQGGWSKRSVDDLIALLMRHWDDRAFTDMEESRREFLRGQEMLEAFFANPYPATLARELGVEAFVNWNQARNGVLAVGKLDRICLLEDGTVEVIDYKCGKRKLTENELSQDVQALFYRTLAAEAFKTLAPRDVRVTFLFLDGPAAVSLGFDHEHFKSRWRIVEATAHAIRMGRGLHQAGVPLEVAFPLNRGGHCRSCPMRRHCDTIEAMPGLLAGT